MVPGSKVQGSRVKEFQSRAAFADVSIGSGIVLKPSPLRGCVAIEKKAYTSVLSFRA
jgi:hypothetical protein